MQNLNSPGSVTELGQSGGLTQTGTPHGGTGAIVLTKTAIQTAIDSGDSDQVRREAGALLERLVPSLRRVVSPDYELVAYQADKPMTQEQRSQITTLSRNLTRPADRQFVVKEVTRCLLSTKSRARDDNDMALLMSVFTEELVKYPPDLVSWSLRKWAQKETWWPSLAEILAPIKKEMGWRNSLETAANTRSAEAHQDGDKASWSSMSEDRKARINEALKRAGLEKVIE